MPRTMTNLQRAEIQLQGILNDPDGSLPASTRRVSDHLSDDNISIEEVSKLLNTQPFIIERLVNALYSSSKDEDIKVLNKFQVHKLTRVLNSTMDVRALLFFMVLDKNHDYFITNTGLSQFYEQYLKDLKTFDKDRSQEVIQVLLQKFHLDQVRKKY
jgi:hypothetical protein